MVVAGRVVGEPVGREDDNLSICLIIPPMGFLKDPLMYVPLGVLYVAGYVRRYFPVKIFDLRGKSISKWRELDVLDSLEYYGFRSLPKADFYGFTANTVDVEWCKWFAKYVKAKYPDSKTIIGGSHATVLPDDCYPYFDYVVVGDGEIATTRIMWGYEEEGVVKGIRVGNLDYLPFPARDLVVGYGLSRRLYNGERSEGDTVSASIVSSRGCPFNCSFCANWDKSVRFRSVENVVGEIKYLVEKYGCRAFHFVDDCFTLRGYGIFELSEALEGLNINFRCLTRADRVDYDMLESLYRAGCREVDFGVETADDYILWKLNKRESVMDFKEAIGMCRDIGLRVKVLWMTGLPYETWETINRNKEFMREMKPDKWTVSLFTPYPNCDIYRNPEKYEVRILTLDWSKYYQYDNESIIETSVATREELTQHYREFLKYCESGEWKK